jgi:sec-independent protein translocase protein TatA
MPGNIGFGEILLLLLVVLFFFGPRRLPQIGRSLGKGIREFRDALSSPSRAKAVGDARPEETLRDKGTSSSHDRE